MLNHIIESMAYNVNLFFFDFFVIWVTVEVCYISNINVTANHHLTASDWLQSSAETKLLIKILRGNVEITTVLKTLIKVLMLHS